ncbi:MAG: hypothetical protein ACI849_000892 [Patiriisocius sp.]|jgi:hypothetical protein
MKPIYILIFSLVLFSCKEKTSSEKLVSETIEEIQTTETKATKENISSETTSLTYAQLQGTWLNIDAPLSRLTFNTNKVVNSYNGIDVKKNILFTIQDTCGTTTTKETPREKDKYIVTTGDTAECYYIVKLDEEDLILGFWGIETALRFKKQ